MTVPKNQLNTDGVDISENDLRERYPEVLATLLRDHTTGKNIFWATDNYAELGEAYNYYAPIIPSLITGEYGQVIRPRVKKDKELQLSRIRDMAEVFTPSWICNVQNNLIDTAWFNRENVFNIEHGETWETVKTRITFPEGKTWKDYVRANRMEITCGEAPYITSRYDTTTGEFIPVESRIGLLDRKMRVINENVETEKDWYAMAEKAFKHTYGYEWQGDNLLLAREALLYTYIEYFMDKFNEKDVEGNYIKDTNGNLRTPERRKIVNAARWISWNLWQMDGIKMVVPDSCDKIYETNLFGEQEKKSCPACQKGEMKGHIGIQCIIRDWNLKKPKNWQPKPGEDPHTQPWQKITFSSLLNAHQIETEDDEI